MSITFKDAVGATFSAQKEDRYKEITGKNLIPNIETLVDICKSSKIKESEINGKLLASWLLYDFDPKSDFVKDVTKKIIMSLSMVVDKVYGAERVKLEQEKQKAIEERHLREYVKFKRKQLARGESSFDKMYREDSDFRTIVDEAMNSEWE